MSRISENGIIEFRERASQIADFIDEGLAWINSNPKHLSDIEVKARRLEKYKTEVDKIIPDLTNKPSLAFFGASQSGKSNMVTNLLKTEDNSFLVYDSKRDIDVDFARFIRPPGGGQESTANLTRFVQYVESQEKKSYPITIKLFSAKDLLLSIMIGYYQYYTTTEDEYDEIQDLIEKTIEKLEAIPDGKSRNTWLTSNDVFAIKEFFKLSSVKRDFYLFNKLNEANFWELLASKAYTLNKNDIDLFAVFWNDMKPITHFFKSYFRTLEKLDFQNEINADFDTVFKNSPEGYDLGNYFNILYVETLKGSNTKENDSVVVYQGDKEVSLHPSLLCGVVKEVIFYVRTESDSIANTFDILDFPGENTAPTVPISNESDHAILCKMLLRGKVTYMFNSYSQNYNIDTLAIGSCIVKQKKGSDKIPTILKNWVEHNIGETPELRTEFMTEIELPPLFVLCTFWNEVLVYDYRSDSPDPGDKISKMLDTRFFNDLFSDFIWRKNWTTNQKYFKNIYLLRDYEYCTLYNPANTTPEPEEGFGSSQQKEFDYYNGVRASFINFNKSVEQNENALDVKNFFYDPEVSFDEASKPNKDGSKFIIHNLKRLDAKYIKLKKYKAILERNYKIALKELENMFIDDSMESRIQVAFEKSKEIHRAFTMHKVGSEYSLAFLQENMLLDRDRIESVISQCLNREDTHNNSEEERFKMIINDFPLLKSKKSKNEKIKFLIAELNLETKEDVELFLDIDLDQLLNFTKMKTVAIKLVDEVFQFWKGKMMRLADTPFNKKYPLAIIVDSLVKNFHFLKIREVIAKSIAIFANGIQIKPVTHAKISDIITSMFNNYLMSGGWCFIDEDARSKQLDLANQNGFECRKDIWLTTVANKDIKFINSVFDTIENYEEGEGVTEIRSNPILYNTCKWRDCLKLSLLSGLEILEYDSDANMSLRKLIDENDAIHLTL